MPRFVHVFLPEDAEDAHELLMQLAQQHGAARHYAAVEEYDHARMHDLVANGGFSHHPGHGEAPTTGFMASYHAPEGSGVAQVHDLSQLHPEHIADHRHTISEHLSKPNSYQGGWLDRTEDKVYLDASRHFHSEPEVRDFALKEKQKAYFNLGNFEEYYLHPKHDPVAMKDQDEWKQKYSHLPKAQRENPPSEYHSFEHLYPATDDQKKFWSERGEHLAVNKMRGRPVGWYRDPRTAEATYHENHPHEIWQKQKFGVYHTSQGRRLPNHLAALASPEDQEENLRRFQEKDPVRRTEHAPFQPDEAMQHGARQYNRRNGLGDPHGQTYGNIRTDVHRVRHIGRAYDSLPEHDESALPHFHAMREEVARQFDHLTNHMGVHVEAVDHDPYRNVHEMVHDVQNNKRLKVLQTAVTGGHPFFSNDENDKFRAVHDAFGHAATGRGFDAHGEEGAYLAHARMFSHRALPAMTSETRGQNASLHLNGDFGPQRVAVLPRHIMNVPILGNGPVDLRRRSSVHEAADWNDYRWLQDAQNRRYERAGVGGGKAEHDEYFGRGEYGGRGTEQKITPKDWISWSRQPGFDDLPAHEQEWHKGYDLGQHHGERAATADFTELDRQHADSKHPDHFYDGYVEGLSTGLDHPARVAVRHGWTGPGNYKLARQLAGDMPNLVRLGHDSGDAETVFHCPFCGSGQVIARNDGTIECEFCQAAFTVQVQPQYPAFPQTINGMPVNVPGMGPQWPGQEDDGSAAGQPVDQMGGAMPPGVGDPDQDQGNSDAPGGDEDDSEDDGKDDDNPFAKKSMLLHTAQGKWLSEDQFLKHVALATARNRDAMLDRIREENAR